MNMSGKHTQQTLTDTDSPLVAKYAWMTSETKEDWEHGMRSALPEMPASIRAAVQTSIHEKILKDTDFENI